MPVHLTLDLEEPKQLNMICLWLSWKSGQYYQYVIEGSLDGARWNILADQRKNTTFAIENGQCFHFPPQSVRYVRVTVTAMSIVMEVSGCIVEIMGFNVSQEAVDDWQCWTQTPPGLNGSVVSIDNRYDRETVPHLAKTTMEWTGTVWRGERVSAQFLLWSARSIKQIRITPTPLRNEQGHEIPASHVQASFVRYVLGDGKLSPDVLDHIEASVHMEPYTVRPIWIAIDVPADAKPGIYKGQLNVQARGGIDPLSFGLSLEVLPNVLAPPSEWSFHLDLWQNPWSVARYHHVKPWSEEHMLLLKPLLTMLAEAGQKCITTTILERPWRGQTYDAFGSMIGWFRQEDGNWRFDYSIFDKYVELCDSCGITKQINCYSMVPWKDRMPFVDEATGDYQLLEAEPKKIAYRNHWRPFLTDFVEHLRERGWLDRTVIALDERTFEETRRLIQFLKKKSPELKTALAGRYYSEIKYDVYDYCFSLFHPIEPALIAERTERGLPTTFYVCCNPTKPNTFVCSPPAESTWMGWHAASQGYTGFLRWAYNSWVKDPLYDTSYVTWMAGDCFLIYPGPRSSIRFERLRDGIEDYEKIQTLRKALQGSDEAQAKKCLQTLDQILIPFNYDQQVDVDYTDVVRKGQAELEKLSRDTAEFMPH